MLRRVKKESALEGRAASRAPSGRGWGLGALEGGVEDGIGSPEGRSAIGAAAGASAAESAIVTDWKRSVGVSAKVLKVLLESWCLGARCWVGYSVCIRS